MFGRQKAIFLLLFNCLLLQEEQSLKNTFLGPGRGCEPMIFCSLHISLIQCPRPQGYCTPHRNIFIVISHTHCLRVLKGLDMLFLFCFRTNFIGNVFVGLFILGLLSQHPFFLQHLAKYFDAILFLFCCFRKCLHGSENKSLHSLDFFPKLEIQPLTNYPPLSSSTTLQMATTYYCST